jgi:hypothetical protein
VTPQEIVAKKISLHQPLTVKQLEAYRRVSLIADMMLKKYPFLQPTEAH